MTIRENGEIRPVISVKTAKRSGTSEEVPLKKSHFVGSREAQ